MSIAARRHMRREKIVDAADTYVPAGADLAAIIAAGDVGERFIPLVR